MAKNYSLLESKVLSFFPIGSHFNWNNNIYTVLVSGKPKVATGKGEPKTDCYIKAINQNNQEEIELKISCKLKDSNEFQENKISASRAEEILGPNWRSIIINTSTKIKNLFENHPNLNNPKGTSRNKLGHIILGWKLEIANKPRSLSAKLTLSDQDIRDYIYKGTNLEDRKRNAKVNNQVIENSGIANYILITESKDIKNKDDVLNQIETIDNHQIKEHYLIFTSNGYMIKRNTTDGNRFLAVRVEWQADLQSNELIPNIKYNSPLESPSRSKDMKKMADEAMLKIPNYKTRYI